MPRPSARDRLLDCAELLFAEHGVAGVSLRAINADAGLSPAALHYHFGTKQALVEALLERRMPVLMARRAVLLDALEADRTPVSARGVVDALLRPLVELLDQEGEAGRRYVRLLVRLQSDGDIDRRRLVARYAAGIDRLEPLLKRALPEQPTGVVRLRMTLAIDTMLRGLADWQNLADVAGADLALDDVVAELLDFLAAGLVAPAHAARTRPGAGAARTSNPHAGASPTGDEA